MKKTLLYTFCLAAFAATAGAETYTVTAAADCSVGKRTNIDATKAAGNDLILDTSLAPAPSAGYKTGYYNVNGTTPSVTSVKATDGEALGYANIRSSLTIGVNTSAAATAMDTKGFTQTFGTLTVTNSSADYQNTNMKLVATDYFNVDNDAKGGPSSQDALFTHYNGTLAAKSVNVGVNAGSGYTSKLTIAADSRLRWDGTAMTIGSKSLGSGELNVNGTLDVGGSIFIDQRGSLNVAEGATLKMNNRGLNIFSTNAQINGALNMSPGSTIYIATTSSLVMGENATFSSSGQLFNFKNHGSFVYNHVNTSERHLMLRKENILYAGSTTTVVGRIDMAGYDAGDWGIQKSTLEIQNGATMTIKNANSSKRDAKYMLLGNTQTDLRQEDAIKDENGKGVRLASACNFNGNGNVVNIYAKQTFKDLFLNPSELGNSLEINLMNDTAKLIFDSEGTTINISSGTALKIKGFADNRVNIGTTAASYNNLLAALKDGRLEIYDTSDKQLLADVIGIDSNGWLTITAVPEPAEWAAIFGAIALGLALYRRRK